MYRYFVIYDNDDGRAIDYIETQRPLRETSCTDMHEIHEDIQAILNRFGITDFAYMDQIECHQILDDRRYTKITLPEPALMMEIRESIQGE